MIKKLPISTALLAVIYVLNLLSGGYSFFMGGFSVVRGILFVLSLITLMAITTTIGEWARITGLAYGGLITVAGVAITIGAIWIGITGDTKRAAFALAGIVFVGIGTWTIAVLRTKPPKVAAHDS